MSRQKSFVNVTPKTEPEWNWSASQTGAQSSNSVERPIGAAYLSVQGKSTLESLMRYLTLDEQKVVRQQMLLTREKKEIIREILKLEIYHESDFKVSSTTAQSSVKVEPKTDSTPGASVYSQISTLGMAYCISGTHYMLFPLPPKLMPSDYSGIVRFYLEKPSEKILSGIIALVKYIRDRKEVEKFYIGTTSAFESRKTIAELYEGMNARYNADYKAKGFNTMVCLHILEAPKTNKSEDLKRQRQIAIDIEETLHDIYKDKPARVNIDPKFKVNDTDFTEADKRSDKQKYCFHKGSDPKTAKLNMVYMAVKWEAC